jgi:lipoprotein-anchoring transpeptidase ErfK/SrfK
MIRLLSIRWLLLPAIALAGPAVFAQKTQMQTPAQPIVAPATPPVAVPEPVAPVPADTTPPVVAPQPTPPVAQPPAVKPPVAPPKKVVKKSEPGDSLRPGQFVWENRTAYKNPLRVIVVLEFQRLYVFDGDDLVGFTTISTGKKGHETPAGIFKILEKRVEHYSNIYDNAPMPYMQRLTWDGIALHAGRIPGYPASHGCIRMPLGFAKALFGATKVAQEVIVIRDTSKAAQPAEPPKEEPKPVEPPKPAPVPAEVPESVITLM